MSSLVQPGRIQSARELILSEASRQRVLPWLLLFLALGLRLYHVGANGLRTDEMYSVWMASRDVPDLFHTIVIEGHDATPPTYYLLLHYALQVSWELWAIRLVSIVSGAVVVWITYHLARQLFDEGVALVSALLLAVAPFSIEISQVARAYTLTAAFVLASLYFYVRLTQPKAPPRTAGLYLLFTLAAIATHYLAGIVVVFQNLYVLALAVLRLLPAGRFQHWIKLQAALGVLALPLAWMAVQRVATPRAGAGQSWLPDPSPAGIVKAFILWGTGDTSYGPGGFTVARLASLVILGAILAVGALTAWRLWRRRPDRMPELRNLAFVAAAFFGSWSLALLISLERKIFHEKYFMYLAPLLFILLAWSLLRVRPVLVGQLLGVALLGLTGSALVIYYTSPTGEQWREAMAYVNEAREPEDFVVTVPGFYVRPATYYLTGQLAPYDYELARAPLAVVGPDSFYATQSPAADGPLPAVTHVLEPAERVWVVTGYSAFDPEQLRWFQEDYQVIEEREFLGVTVRLGERMAEATPVGHWWTARATHARAAYSTP